LAVGVVGAVAALVGYVLAAGERIYRATGDSYPGLLTAAAEPVGFFAATLAGALTVGGLTYVALTARPTQAGVIDAPAYRAHLLVERAATAWALLAAGMVVIQASHSAGAPVGDVLTSVALPQTIVASEMSRAWVVVALMAAITAVTVRLSVRWIPHVVLLIPALVGVVAVVVSGNAGQGPDHDYATSTAIVFAAAFATTVGLKLVAACTKSSAPAARRVLTAQLVIGAIALTYGAALFTILTATTNPVATAYGRAGIAAFALWAAVWFGDVRALRRGVGGPARGLLGAVAVIVVMALYASMATQPAPRFLNHQFSTWDVFLGYSLPAPPSVLTILVSWRFDTFLGAASIVLAGLYLFGCVGLRRRGDHWPMGRLVAWLVGCAVLLFTTSSGVKAYGSAMFSVHMAEHMTLNMFVPVLLVLGGPVTLALRVLPAAGDGQPPGPREWLLWLIHSRFTAFLSNPITAFVLFVASLYAVYFTPIFGTLVRYHWGHELMSVHFLLVGYLFFWAIIGIDPGPRRLPFLGRLGMLFAVMPFHAFFGIATMNMTSTIGGQFYQFVGLPWLSSIASDQHLGGAIAWGSSELPVIVVVVALVAQWARHDRRAAVRSDRHADADYADDDFDSYNAMLRELARKRQ
jgi:putative copper resistance protein D